MPTRELTPFATLLLRYRAAAHLTQEQLAARAGLSPDTIAALERGKRRMPRAASVELLAEALGLEAQERAQLAAAARASGIPPRVRPAAMADGGIAHAAHQRPWWLGMEPTPLVDRTHELDIILQSLAVEGVRLLTLTGPAGVGKTRLALAAATQLLEDTDRFLDGITLVDLAPVRDPDLVPGAIARALGLLDVGALPTLDRLVEALAERRQLLVVDNVEQVLPATATQLADLLATCRGLSLLVTSRVPLQIRLERTLRVPPLPVPDSTAPLPPPEELVAIPAIALFVQRARACQADFMLTEQQAPLVARLVAQLDGLPLALELAAARLDVLPLPTLARLLGDRLRLLASEAPDRPERQRSLEAAVGWSYDLLSAPERRLFRCLGVFVGRVSLDAIAAVVSVVSPAKAAGPEEGDGEVEEPGKTREAREEGRTLPRLLSLAEKSLVLPLSTRPNELVGRLLGLTGQQSCDSEPTEAEEFDEDPEPEFGMLETVREYAWERLAVEGELAAAQRAHAHYFLALAERAAPTLHGRAQRAWYLRLEREQDNLRAALRWLLDQAGPDGSDAAAEREAGLRLAGALGYFWYVRGHHTEGRRWLEEALACAPQGKGVDSAARTRALVAAGPLLMMKSDYARAQAVLKEALALAQQRQDPVVTAAAYTYLGHGTVLAGDVEQGTRLLHEARRRWEDLGDSHGLGETLFYLGYAADVIGDADAAAVHYTDALQQMAAAGNAQHAGFVHCYLGLAAGKHGDLPRAVEHIQAVLQTCVALRDRWLLSFAAQATVVLVGVQAQPAAWARLLGASDALGHATGGATFGWEHLPGAQNVVGLREQLVREGEWGVAYREGRTLNFAKVAALALTLLDEVAQALPHPDTEVALGRTQLPERWPQYPNQSALSAREREVLRLVAQGLTSRAIGRQLFISERTVAQHINTIFNKLGVKTRAQAAVVASGRGLL